MKGIRRGVLALALASAAATLPGAQAATSLPSIQRVIHTDVWAGISPYVPVHDMLDVTFSDSTPTGAASYGVTATDGTGKVLATGSYTSGVGPTYTFSLDPMAWGSADNVALYVHVDELASTGAIVDSAPVKAFTYRYLQRPARLTSNAKNLQGVWSIPVGAPTRLAFSGGAFAPGTRFTTQAFVAGSPRLADFGESIWSANTHGGALVNASNTTAPVLSFTARPKDINRWVFVSVMAHLPGSADYVWWFPAFHVVRGPMPAGWVTSFGGQRTPGATVGAYASVSAPTYSQAAIADGARATHQWYINGVPVAGATRRWYAPTAWSRGKRLTLLVIVNTTHYTARKIFSFGYVR